MVSLTYRRGGVVGVMLAIAGSAPAVTVTGVYNSGVDATGAALAGGNGTTDPHYRIAGGTAPGAVAGQPARTFDEFGWFMPDTVGSRAINATGSGDADWFATIIFRTTFDLTGYTPGTAMLSVTAQADDSASIELNGHRLTSSIGYWSATPFTTADPAFFVAGINVLDFIVRNEAGHTALRVDNLGVTADPTVAVVPEPGSWALLVGGFGLIGAAARCRRWRYPAVSG